MESILIAICPEWVCKKLPFKILQKQNGQSPDHVSSKPLTNPHYWTADHLVVKYSVFEDHMDNLYLAHTIYTLHIPYTDDSNF